MKQYRFNTQKRYKEKNRKKLKKTGTGKTDFVKQMNFISRDTDQKNKNKMVIIIIIIIKTLEEREGKRQNKTPNSNQSSAKAERKNSYKHNKN